MCVLIHISNGAKTLTVDIGFCSSLISYYFIWTLVAIPSSLYKTKYLLHKVNILVRSIDNFIYLVNLASDEYETLFVETRIHYLSNACTIMKIGCSKTHEIDLKNRLSMKERNLERAWRRNGALGTITK
ncbi:hypothetical protein KP509_27G040100 [Ceratopteris richardii]|uniref:Uncharacterized protein n=1 Tax=Ceratopteris richardii TaxID=49495 RepID=A0A8T2RFS5_CERRI|nr:hypothetical protein KP509_27G040100 [Ceratopteris richardii]